MLLWEELKKYQALKYLLTAVKIRKKAKFTGPDMGKFAWRRFVFETKLKPGSYKIVSQASAGGKSQPKLRMENRRGYAHNGWLDHGLDITVS